MVGRKNSLFNRKSPHKQARGGENICKENEEKKGKCRAVEVKKELKYIEINLEINNNETDLFYYTKLIFCPPPHASSLATMTS